MHGISVFHAASADVSADCGSGGTSREKIPMNNSIIIHPYSTESGRGRIFSKRHAEFAEGRKGEDVFWHDKLCQE